MWLQTSWASTGRQERTAANAAALQPTLSSDSFGPQPLAIGRRSIGHRVVLGAGATLLMAAIVGIAAVYTAVGPRDADSVISAQVPGPSDAAESSTAAPDVGAASLGGAEDDAALALVAAAVEVPPKEDPAVADTIGIDVDTVAPAEAPDAESLETLAVPAAAISQAQEFEATLPDAMSMTDPSAAASGPALAVDMPEPVDAPDPAEIDAEALVSVDAQADPDVVGTAPKDAPSIAEPSVGGAEEQPTTTWRNGWVCGGSFDLEDPTGSRWSVTRVSFLPRSGFERVLLTVERRGPDRGSPASVTAETFDNATLRERFPNIVPPSSGRNAIVLNLADGARSPLNLRGYRPQGLQTVREFSVFQSPNGTSKLVVGVAGEGCFRLRAPVWYGDARDGVQQIQLDVKG